MTVRIRVVYLCCCVVHDLVFSSLGTRPTMSYAEREKEEHAQRTGHWLGFKIREGLAVFGSLLLSCGCLACLTSWLACLELSCLVTALCDFAIFLLYVYVYANF